MKHCIFEIFSQKKTQFTILAFQKLCIYMLIKNIRKTIVWNHIKTSISLEVEQLVCYGENCISETL